MKQPYELIVFDWDGTLMDSESRIVTCMRLAAADAGLPVPAPRAARDIIGLGMQEAVMTLFPEAGAEEVGAIIDAYRGHWLGDNIPASALFPGAVDLVDALDSAGYLLAVATGKSRRGLDKVFEETGLGGRFHASRCADETCSKPHPQMLNELIVDLDSMPARTLVVGDTEYDMQMAGNASTDCVGMTHGVHSPERLLQHGAMHCFGDLAALRGWLLGDGEQDTTATLDEVTA